MRVGYGADKTACDKREAERKEGMKAHIKQERKMIPAGKSERQLTSSTQSASGATHRYSSRYVYVVTQVEKNKNPPEK